MLMSIIICLIVFLKLSFRSLEKKNCIIPKRLFSKAKDKTKITKRGNQVIHPYKPASMLGSVDANSAGDGL